MAAGRGGLDVGARWHYAPSTLIAASPETRLFTPTGIERGRAREGDKTLLDVMIPAARELSAQAEASAGTELALRCALAAAAAGLRRTAHLSAARGRAKRLAERSRGHQDAGAASSFLIWRYCARTLVPGLELDDVIEV